MTPIQIETALQNLDSQVAEAAGQFEEWVMTGNPWEERSWNIEVCFLQLLALLESLNMPEFRSLVSREYESIRTSEDKFVGTFRDPDGDNIYSSALSRIRRHRAALRVLLPKEKHTVVRKDVLQIIRNVHYVITDRDVFTSVPQNENDVHQRIEMILKCVFPDLKRKPTLSKQIKNFEPDTGIPSLQTLIEYKFLSQKHDVGTIADQILADTRGYTSSDWQRFLYVIYETQRFKTEDDWNQLLRESGVPTNTRVVVLSGEPRTGTEKVSKKRTRRKVSSSARQKKT